MAFEAVELLDQAAGVLPDVVELRRRIHQHPELGLQLPNTQQAVLDSLAELPVSVRTGAALTSVVADLAGGRGDGTTIQQCCSVFVLPVDQNAPSGTIATRGGPIMAAPDVLNIRVRGRGGHASSPYQANDPMPVAAEIVTALQVFATRRIDTFDPVVITI